MSPEFELTGRNGVVKNNKGRDKFLLFPSEIGKEFVFATGVFYTKIIISIKGLSS